MASRDFIPVLLSAFFHSRFDFMVCITHTVSFCLQKE